MTFPGPLPVVHAALLAAAVYGYILPGWPQALLFYSWFLWIPVCAIRKSFFGLIIGFVILFPSMNVFINFAKWSLTGMIEWRPW
ncbi:MAG: hypothetical protein ACR2P6_05725 [Gammaproteobacteria bacterium]